MQTGKVALITGSSRGIGKSIAYRLAEAGAAIAINGTDQENVNHVVEQIQANGGKAIGVCESVETIAGGERIVKTVVDRFGKVDILVNNAGINRDHVTVNMTDDEWQSVIDVNLTGTFACSRAVIRDMKNRGKGGSILNLTSTAGLMGSVGQVNYSAAKAGMLGMTWTWADELKRYGIRVNAVAPAALTDMTRPVIEKVKAKSLERGVPFPEFWKVGSPEDVAQLVYYLTRDENKDLTGGVYSVNGKKIGYWEKPQQRIVLDDLNESAADFRAAVSGHDSDSDESDPSSE